MAGKIAPIIKKQMLEELFGVSNTLQIGDIYAGYGTTAPTPVENSSHYFTVTEASGAGYSREPVGLYGQSLGICFGNNSIAPNSLVYNDDGSVTIKNHRQIKFDTWNGSNISVKYILLFTAKTGGNCIGYFELATPVTLETGMMLVINTGEASATLA